MKIRIILAFCAMLLLTGAVIKRGPGGGGGGAAGVPCTKLYIENPAVELFETVAHFDKDVTISRMVCQCRGGVDIDFVWKDDGFDIEAVQACPTSGGLDDTTIASPDVAAGSDIDLSITDVDGAVTDCSLFLYCG